MEVIFPDIQLLEQVVYNANELGKLVKKRDKMQNWLDYYLLKYSRNTSKRPVTKVNHEMLYLEKRLGLVFSVCVLTHCSFVTCLKIFFILVQTGFLGLSGEKVDAIDYYTSEVEKLSKEVSNYLLVVQWFPSLLLLTCLP